MNKIYLALVLICFNSILCAHEHSDETLIPVLNVYEINHDIRNPFLEINDKKEDLKDNQLSELTAHLKKAIIGYVESSEQTKSHIRTRNTTIRVGESLGEGPLLGLKLVNITGDIVYFEKEGIKFSVDMKRDLFIREKPIAKGVIIHPEGWVLANADELNMPNSLYVYLNDIAFPIKRVGCQPEKGIALFKIYNEHKDLKLPYVKISENEPQEGDVLYAQSYFCQEMPYMKQVVMDVHTGMHIASPEIDQNTGASILNEKLELVGFKGKIVASYNEILELLDGVPLVDEKKQQTSLSKASVSIVNE